MIEIILRLPTDSDYWTNSDDDLTHVIANTAADWESAVRSRFPDADVSLELVPSSVPSGGKTVAYRDGDEADDIVDTVMSIRERINISDPAMWEQRV